MPIVFLRLLRFRFAKNATSDKITTYGVSGLVS